MFRLPASIRAAALNRAFTPATFVRRTQGYQGTIQRSYSSAHEEESYEAFNDRYAQFFENVDDSFELQRGLNNCFAYDLVPSTTVIEAALKAARRVNDYAVASRVFEGVREKVENDAQYQQYLEVLKPLKEELGVLTREEMGF